MVRRVSVESSVGQSPHHGLQDDVYEAEGGSSFRGDTPMSFFLEADLPEPVIQREVSTEGESDFFQHRNVVWKPESGKPAEVEAEPGEGLGRGQEVIDLPETEGSALEGVAELLGHAIDVSMQEIEERSVYYREEELPVLELEEPPNEWEGSPTMEMRLRGRPEDRHVRPESQLWNRGWRSTLGWRLLIFLPYFRGQLGTSPGGRMLTHVTWLSSWMIMGLNRIAG